MRIEILQVETSFYNEYKLYSIIILTLYTVLIVKSILVITPSQKCPLATGEHKDTCTSHIA